MRPRLFQPKTPGVPAPRCDIINGNSETELVHFGEPASRFAEALPFPLAVNLGKDRVRIVAEDILGMKSGERFAELETENAELRAKLAEIEGSRDKVVASAIGQAQEAANETFEDLRAKLTEQEGA